MIVMIIWAVIKVAAPASYVGGAESEGIFQKFYGIALGDQVVLILGVAQSLVLPSYDGKVVDVMPQILNTIFPATPLFAASK